MIISQRMNKIKISSILLKQANISKYLSRPYTCIVERHIEPKLAKKGVDPRKINLRGENFQYKFVETSQTKKWGEVNVLLTEFIEGLGYKGECVTVDKHTAHYELIPSKLAVFPSKENLELFKTDIESLKTKPKMSKYAAKTRNDLNKMLLEIQMNTGVDWVLNKDHVRIALRYNNYMISNEYIELPSNHESIKSDKRDYYKDEFIVKIKINDYTEAALKCKIVPINKTKLLEKFSMFNKKM